MLTPAISVEVKPNVSFSIGDIEEFKLKVEDRKDYRVLKPDIPFMRYISWYKCSWPSVRIQFCISIVSKS